ncbi:MAG: fibronectin type III domain-containing protein, partial [Nitrospira sp.]|nr:fibronectin type III domain-containing protein [Nitrospira sp.]
MAIWNPDIGLTIYKSTGSSFTVGWSWSPPSEAISGLFGDVNGDGKADQIYNAYYSNCSNLGITGSCTSWQVQLSTGGNFGPAASWFAYDSSFTHVWVKALDFDGDGKSDLILDFGGTKNALYVATSTGSNFGGANKGWWLLPRPTESKDRWRFGDFNGDGLTDFLILTLTDTSGAISGPDYAQGRVYLSKGNSFDTGTLWLARSNTDWDLGYIYTGDFNGDGKTDLLSYHTDPTPDHWDVDLSSGISGTGPGVGLNAPGSREWGSATGGFYADLLEDFDGDGKIDRGEYWGETVPSVATLGDVKIFLSSGPPVDLLETIRNSLGGTTTNAYVSSSKANACATNPNYLPFKLQTVCSITQDDGMGHSFTTSHTYQGGKYDSESKEFWGFSQVAVTDPTGALTKTIFLQDSVFKGKPSLIEACSSGVPPCGVGTLFSKTVNAWDSSIPFVGVSFPFLKQVDTHTYDGGSTAKQAQVQYTYDCQLRFPCYGNLEKTANLGQVSPSLIGDELYDYIEYFPHTEKYIVGLPAHAYTRAADDVTKVAEAWNYYDGASSYTTPPTKGNLTRVCSWLNGGTNPCTTFGYDSVFGNLTSTTDAKGNSSTVTYDATYKTFPKTETNALNHTVTKGYDSLMRLTSVTDDLNNVTTTYEYDALHRLTKEVIPPDATGSPTTIYTYNNPPDLRDGTAPEGTLVRKRDPAAGGNLTLDSYTYVDGFGHTIQTKAEGPSSTQWITVDTGYNSWGLVEGVSIPHHTSISPYTTPQTQQPKTTTSYDSLRRIIEVINTDGTKTNWCYDKWITRVMDPKRHQKRETRDAYGRLIIVEEYEGIYSDCNSSIGTPYSTTTYQYDTLGNLIQMTDTLGNITAMTYDTLGRKTTMRDPDMGKWLYEYDAVGNLIHQTDGKGQITEFTYDALNRIKTKSHAGTETSPPFAPGNLTATTVSSSQINLSWTTSTDNVGVAGYQVERCQGSGCSNFTQVGTSTVNSFSDTGLSDGVNYSYRVRAVDTGGNLSNYSNTASASTTDISSPTVPSDLMATVVSSDQINLSWTASTDNVGVTGYRLERCQGAGCTSFAQIATLATTNYNDTGLTASTNYSYRVRAVDAALNLSAYSNIASGTTQLAAPMMITATDTPNDQGGSINLNWSPSTSTDVIQLRIYRSTTSGGPYILVATITGNTTCSYLDTGLINGTAYYYVLRAWNGTQESQDSNEMRAVPLDNTALPTPMAWYRMDVPDGKELDPSTIQCVGGVNPKALWHFNTVSGGTASDASGNNYTGTLTGSTLSTAGKFGNTLSFDGVDDYVDAGDISATEGSALTVAFWMKGGAAQKDFAALVTKGTDGSAGTSWRLQRRSNFDEVRFTITNSIGTNNIVTGATGVFDNQWHHIAGTFDGTELRLYKDGVLVGGPVSVASPPETIQNTTQVVSIGSYDATLGGDWTTRAFNGSIDEVAIYDIALTSAQIWDHYYRGIAEDVINNDPNTVEANDGQTVGPISINAQPSLNQALSFDGQDDYVDAGDINVTENTSALTVAFWMKGDNTQKDFAGLVMKGTDGPTDSSWRLQRRGSSNELRWTINTAGANNIVTGATGVFDNQWHHIAGTYDGAELRLYKDGVLVGGPVQVNSPGPIQDTARVVSIGSYDKTLSGDWTSRAFNGLIDDVKLFNQALNPQQIVIEAGLTPETEPPTTPAGLTATAMSISQIDLSWNASTDNTGVAEYRVERCQGA